MKTERSRELSTSEALEQIANVASMEATLTTKTTNGTTMVEDHLRPIPTPTTTPHLTTWVHRTTQTTLTNPMTSLCVEAIHELMLKVLLQHNFELSLTHKGKGKDLGDLTDRQLPQAGVETLSVSSFRSNDDSHGSSSEHA
jgi:hypothetical protein